MANLFYKENKPLAERMRPRELDQVIGQQHLVGEQGIIRKLIQSQQLSSLILWGPPGTGKTTLAQVISQSVGKQFYKLSAVQSGVKEVRKVIAEAQQVGNVILFIDEIHRFNKSQQDALLGAVESGEITLIGATTENPSFEVNAALLSRSQVLTLNPLSQDELTELADRALSEDEQLSTLSIKLSEYEALTKLAGGDARKLLNLIELVVQSSQETDILITNDRVVEAAQTKMALYDKNGEQHYDIISAFIKSVRGSDPDAAVYWLARMLEGGEDIKFIARRLVILAAEDIGLANPNALVLANSTFEAVQKIGMPEARIVLSECTIYLATSAKSNSAYRAIDIAIAEVRKSGDLPVPLSLRNAPTKLMKEQGYGEGYKYAHDYQDSFVEHDFLPSELKDKVFYTPASNKREDTIREWLQKKWDKHNTK